MIMIDVLIMIYKHGRSNSIVPMAQKDKGCGQMQDCQLLIDLCMCGILLSIFRYLLGRPNCRWQA